MSRASSTADSSDDAFLGGRLRILQPKDGYRAGLDAVLLAAAAEEATTNVLDVGAGVGVVGLAVAARLRNAQVMLVEQDAGLAALARANVARNGLSDRVRLTEADITRPLGGLTELGALAESFDCVLANPPYHAEGQGTSARDASKATAHAMAEGGLERWARFMAAMARPGGSALVIHKAEALPELLAAFAGRFGDLLLLPIHPRAEASATRVLLRGTKGSRAPLRLRPGLVLHDQDGGFRPDVEAVLRHGAALSIDPTVDSIPANSY